MTPAAALLHAEIARLGPISFERFMEVALYHPEHGYYCRARQHNQAPSADPFGKSGDFFTAEQIQPVFGMLIARSVRALMEDLSRRHATEDLTVVELGAGREDMRPFFSDWRYIPIESQTPSLPGGIRGVFFANELFDALPVAVLDRATGQWRELLVHSQDGAFAFTPALNPLPARSLEYLRHFAPLALEEENFIRRVEINLRALDYLDRIFDALDEGFLFAIDYGYTAPELLRFPEGSLMSYRRHRALDDVLAEPGLRDITAHVNFTALQTHALRRGWQSVRFETLAQTLLRAGETDRFAEVLANGDRARTLQLKTLLFGMGETFRTLVLRKSQ